MRLSWEYAMNRKHSVHKCSFLFIIYIVVISLILSGCGDVATDKDELFAPPSPEESLITDHLPEVTLNDATTILNVYPVLPNTFRHNSQVSEASVSGLLGTSSKSEIFIEGQLPSLSAEGEVIETRPWCQIQGILWVVDSDTAEAVSIVDAMEEYGLDGSPVNLGMQAEALLSGGDGSGLDFLMIKYGRVFVVLVSWYSHPRDNYVSVIDLGKVIVERISRYDQ